MWLKRGGTTGCMLVLDKGEFFYAYQQDVIHGFMQSAA
jgi:hypothetical protein